MFTSGGHRRNLHCSGKVEELRQVVEIGADTVIADGELSPAR